MAGEINVLVKSRRDVHNIHEINGVFTLGQKQSCAISSVTRSGENLNSGPVGGGGMLMYMLVSFLGDANFFDPWFTICKIKGHSDRKYPLFVIKKRSR